MTVSCVEANHGSRRRQECRAFESYKGVALHFVWLCCRQLLARLCLVREELSVVAAEQGSDSSGSDFAEAKVTYQRLIPQGTAAFVKEMLGVSSKDRRHALFRFQDCFGGHQIWATDNLSTFSSRQQTKPSYCECWLSRSNTG